VCIAAFPRSPLHHLGALLPADDADQGSGTICCLKDKISPDGVALLTMGALLTRGDLRIVGGRWPLHLSGHLHINALEILAVAMTVAALDLVDTQLHIFIDNRAALSHLQKKLTTLDSFWFAAAKRFTVTTLRVRSLVLKRAEWVRSANNVADAASRSQDAPISAITNADIARTILSPPATASA
jgi:hypothetical protein